MRTPHYSGHSNLCQWCQDNYNILAPGSRLTTIVHGGGGRSLWDMKIWLDGVSALENSTSLYTQERGSELTDYERAGDTFQLDLDLTSGHHNQPSNTSAAYSCAKSCEYTTINCYYHDTYRLCLDLL